MLLIYFTTWAGTDPPSFTSIRFTVMIVFKLIQLHVISKNNVSLSKPCTMCGYMNNLYVVHI